MCTTEERLENALDNHPERYLGVRDKNDRLVEVADKDTGRVWIRCEDKWIWIE